MDDEIEVRARVLQVIWRQIRGLNETNVQNNPAAKRAIESGGSAEDVVRAMRYAAYEMAFGMLYSFTGEHADESDATTGWALVEADILHDYAVPNGSNSLDGLYESLLGADPTGLEAQDFLS